MKTYRVAIGIFVLMLFISIHTFSQSSNKDLKVGVKYRIVGTGTLIYDSPNYLRNGHTVPGNSIVTILREKQNGFYYVKHENSEGHISADAISPDAIKVEPIKADAIKVDPIKADAITTDPISVGISERVKIFVESEINKWQKKGEFEKIIDYQKRVNIQTRDAEVHKLIEKAINKIKDEFKNTITPQMFTLGEYDADNESYLISSNDFGSFALKVPITLAKTFKSNWNKQPFKNIDLALNEGRLYIQKIDINIAEQTFSYNSQVETSYSTNSTAWNFDPLSIDIPNQKNIENSTRIQNRTIAVGKSDIDIDIPTAQTQNPDFFAVIIGNEEYKNEIKANYAINDANSVHEYFNKVLGIPLNNIHLAENATFGKMLSEIDWLNNVSKVFNGSARLFFYYAGHGMPNEQTRSAYLLPTDGMASITQTAVKLEDLYEKLTQFKTMSVTLFLDACFSGAAREGQLAKGRGISIKPKDDILKGNIVVFSAASGDETAYPYNDKQHGLFTYFLLKSIKESNGEINYGELSEYIKNNVSKQSVILNRKNQTPQTNVGFELEQDWKSLKIK